LFLLLLLPSAAGLNAQGADSSNAHLGTPPIFREAPEPPRYRAPLVPRAGGLSIDPSSRAASRRFFYEQYQNAPCPDSEWDGSVSSCVPGTTADAFKDAVMHRINYFRAMAGIPADIDWNPGYSEKDQEAALMMSANGALSHDPPTSWECYFEDGDEAAGHSNLALGAYGCTAISLYMKDPGAGNEAAGHRRWILYPQTREMGTGDIPHGAGGWASNALWVVDEDDPSRGSRPQTREEYVAWPPPGYVPYPVVYPRWSFAYAGASFGSASVTVTRSGSAVPVEIYSPADGYGENTLVWLMDNMSSHSSWPAPESDEVYHVTVANVMIGGAPHTFTYSVKVFDPAQERVYGIPAWQLLLLE
jgi:hypothetical protein